MPRGRSSVPVWVCLGIALIAFAGCGDDARSVSHAAARTTASSDASTSVSTSATAGRPIAPAGSADCASSSRLRAFAAEAGLTAAERRALRELMTALRLHPQQHASCISGFTTAQKPAATKPASPAVLACLQALAYATTLAQLPEPVVHVTVRTTARRAAAAINAAERHGDQLCS